MKTGVIIGRFQCHKLTDGHKELINYVISKSDKVLIFIGVSPLKPDIKNPLPFEMRKSMVSGFVPYRMLEQELIRIIPIVDVFNIPRWSRILDYKIYQEITIDDEVILYGGRDSFNYVGSYQKRQIESTTDSSATELRNQILATDISSVGEEFRKGIIWATGKLDA